MKKAILIAVLFTVMAGGGLFAQAIPGGFASPQSQATQGRLRSAADDFIRPDSYSGVSFENWYGMASFASTNTATLGYATKVGEKEEGGRPIFIGVFYSGSFWANVTIPEYTEQISTFTGVEKNIPVYGAIDLASNPSNQIAVLIGVANMGFRLSFRTTYESFRTDGDSLINSIEYKSYETGNGLISPQFAWSMAKNITADGIKPWVTFDMGFNRDYTKTERYSNASGSWVARESIGNSQNNIAPEFNIGLGGYTFANKNGWRTSADIEYRLQMTMYDNEYNYTDEKGENKIKSFKGTYSGTALAERSSNAHRVRPSLSTQWNGEKLRLRGRLDLNLIFSGSENNPMALKSDNSGSLVNTGNTAKNSTFQFNPDMQLAAQWQAASRLFLNVGGRINLLALSSTTTEGKEYTNGEEVEKSDYKIIAKSYGAAQNHLNIGVTLNATDNLSIEAVTGLSGTSKNTNRLNFFDTSDTGLFNFGSILVALKF
jgi:hypothetical protein